MEKMNSLEEVCNSLEQVWKVVSMHEDFYDISQDMLAQVYRWKVLFENDPPPVFSLTLFNRKAADSGSAELGYSSR